MRKTKQYRKNGLGPFRRTQLQLQAYSKLVTQGKTKTEALEIVAAQFEITSNGVYQNLKKWINLAKGRGKNKTFDFGIVRGRDLF